MSEDKFVYNYSAPTEEERREIEDIKKQFMPEEKSEDKLTRLRRLNKKVYTAPKIFALSFGIAALLVFGLGMTMTIEWSLYIWGAIVGAVGVALMCVTNIIYKALLARNKKRYGQTIIDLSNELLNENGNKEVEYED